MQRQFQFSTLMDPKSPKTKHQIQAKPQTSQTYSQSEIRKFWEETSPVLKLWKWKSTKIGQKIWIFPQRWNRVISNKVNLLGKYQQKVYRFLLRSKTAKNKFLSQDLPQSPRTTLSQLRVRSSLHPKMLQKGSFYAEILPRARIGWAKTLLTVKPNGMGISYDHAIWLVDLQKSSQICT